MNKPYNKTKRYESILKNYKKLDNGVTIYFSKNIESIEFTYGFGSSLDKDIGINGICHYFEHFIFKRDYIKDLNAATGADIMAFSAFGTEKKHFHKLLNLFYGWDRNYYELITSPTYFDDTEDLITSLKREMENEFYYRVSKRIGLDNVYTVCDEMPIYLGGRYKDFGNDKQIRSAIVKIWKNLDPKDIYILLPQSLYEYALPILKQTFGTKKKTASIPKKKISLIKPKNNLKLENPFIIVGANIEYYSLIFRFNKSELPKIKRYVAALNYFTDFSFPTDYYDLGDDILVKHYDKNVDNIKLLLFNIKNNLISNILNFNDALKFVKYKTNEYIEYYGKYVLPHMETIKELSSLTPIEILDLVSEYFTRLYNKIYVYGDFYLVNSDSDPYTNKKDYYGFKYLITPSSMDKYLINYGYDYDVEDIFRPDILLKSDTTYCTFRPNVKQVKEKFCTRIHKSQIPYALSNPNINSIEYDGDYVTIISSNRDKLEKIQKDCDLCQKNNGSNKAKTVTTDTLGNVFQLYMFQRDANSISNLLWLIRNNYTPKYTPISNFNLVITGDKKFNITTPYNFLVYYFIVPKNSEYSPSVLEHWMKQKGLCYSIRYYEIVKNKEIINYVFLTTSVIDESEKYVTSYIKSFHEELPIVLIRSDEGSHYDFSSLDSNPEFVKVI